MPSDREDALFGGKRGSARKAYAAIIERYGPRKGEGVYFALVAKRRRTLGLRKQITGRRG